MFPPAVARALRELGHDVVAVNDRPELISLQDPELFEVAQQDQRAIVTENVADFMPLDARWRKEGRDHYGLVFILKDNLPRRRPQLIGAMVKTLDTWLSMSAKEPDPHSLIAWP